MSAVDIYLWYMNPDKIIGKCFWPIILQNRIFVESVIGARVKLFQCEENDFQSHTNLIIAAIMTTAKAEQLSKEDEERLKDLFHKLDRNKDGHIDIDDLSAVFKSSSKSVASQTKVKPHKCNTCFQ